MAAILFPVFARARENARRSSCQSNLKQIGLGILQYVQDYDEKFPKETNAVDNTYNNGLAWAFVIQPYTKSTQVFKCPSNTSSLTMRNTNGTIPVSYKVVAGTWDTSGDSGNAAKTYGGKVPFAGLYEDGRICSLSELDSSATTILVYETWGDSNYPNDVPSVGDVTSLNFQNHLGTTNFLFADGHVKSLKPLATGQQLNMWNVKNKTNSTDATTGPAPASLLTQLGAQQQLLQ